MHAAHLTIRPVCETVQRPIQFFWSTLSGWPSVRWEGSRRIVRYRWLSAELASLQSFAATSFALYPSFLVRPNAQFAVTKSLLSSRFICLVGKYLRTALLKLHPY